MTTPAAASRPNIVLLISDDHGYGDLSPDPTDEGLHTPNLERLRNSGVTFSRGYVTAPICSPSRAGLIAGAHQARWGAHWFDNSAFPPGEREVGPETLHRLGYRTGYFGKVHYGQDLPDSRSCPERHGFDESLYGLAAQSMGRLHYMSHSAEEASTDPEKALVHGTGPLYDGGVPVDTNTHLTQLFADRAIDFIERATTDGNPYFCMVAFNAVHNFTWQLPEDELKSHGLPERSDFDPSVEQYVDWYDGAISPNLENGRAYYLAQLDMMDRHIGRILDTVDASGQAGRTMVVYLTDNGGSTCNYGDNGPLTGTKYTLYEGGIRVPFLVRWPGVADPGSHSDALVSALDLMPTFIAAAGGRTEPELYDGQDLAKVLQGEIPGHRALYFDTGVQQAIVRTDAKWRRIVDGENLREALLKVEHTDIGIGESVVQFRDGLADEKRAFAEDSSVPSADFATFRSQFDGWVRSVSG